MKIKLIEIIKNIAPPLFLHIAKQLRDDWISKKEWKYIPEGWAYAETHPEVRGWNVDSIMEVYNKKWAQYARIIEGTGPLGVSHESDLKNNADINSHNMIMVFGYALALASRKKDRISMLDWGGGNGHYYLLAKALLPKLEIDYHCKDVPVLCEYGAKIFPKQHFYTDESCFDNVYDFVLASASLQYTKNWQRLMCKLADATNGYLYIANLPVIQEKPSFVFLQRPYKYGYDTEYLAWCLNNAEFLCGAERAKLYLMREFVYGYQPFIHGAPEQNVYRGYLFVPFSE